MARDIVDLTPIKNRNELVSWMSDGIKPTFSFKIGTEHEKIPFFTNTLEPVPYGGSRGIRALLLGLQALNGWDAIMEGENIIGLADIKGGGAISLEPGGQFELSGAPLDNLHQTLNETQDHLEQIKWVAKPLGISFLSLGASPKWKLQDTPIMPKARYKIMANYMPKVGSHGLDMMFTTSTVQVNLDFSSEANMVKKLRVSLALQPLATALFANSPFTNGKLNGFKSFRSEIWRDTDNQRAGMLPFAFETGMGFERYVDYALDVPMYFLKRGDTYHDVTGASFRDLMSGNFKLMPHEQAYISDWANHLGTIFPEVRLKRYLEMRGGDVGSLAMIAAFSAFWTGLLYDESALNAAWDIVKHWTQDQRQTLRDDVPKSGLESQIAGRGVLDIVRELIKLSAAGLTARTKFNANGQDETIHLAPLYGLIDAGKTQADALIEQFNTKWQGKIEPVFSQCIY